MADVLRWDDDVQELIPVCPTCGEDVDGCMWGPRGECRSCWEAALLPPASFHDEYLSPYNETTGADY